MPSKETGPQPAASKRAPARPAASRGGAPAQERELRAQGRQTMQRLLVAGQAVFDKQGFHSARVDDIVKAAKTSHGTFYLYFANKEDLFKALAMDAMSEMENLGRQLGPITADDAGRAALREWVMKFVDIYAAHGSVIRAWTDREFADRELGHRAQASLLALSGALSRRIDEVRSLGDRSAVEGVACLSMLERFNYFQQSHQVRFERDATIDTLTRAMFEGFFVPDSAVTKRRPRAIAARPRRTRRAG
jgi:AcrR family transcriptional regulator